MLDFEIGTPLLTHVHGGQDDFDANKEAMEAMLGDLSEFYDLVQRGGGEKYVERHRARGKMLARERIEALVDPSTPLLELSPLAGAETKDPLGAGVVVGLGEVSGTQCLIIANDPTVRGGTTSPSTIKKLLRAMDIAESCELPLVILVESGGADLPNQADVFVPGGEQFRRLTQLSAAGIATICVVFGSSTAGGAYLPGMSDYTIFVEGQAKVFLGGPPLVKMAIGEEADEESLGGADMHARISGLCDYLAHNENDAIKQARLVVAHLRDTKFSRTSHDNQVRPNAFGAPRLGARRFGQRRIEPPLANPDELLGIAPADVRVPFDAREILARILDGSRFEEFKALYGNQLLCGWGSLSGFSVGILANQGILFSPEAQKGAQFIQLCNRIPVPIIFIQNITGFMVGTRYEQGGIIKDGAKLINAVSNSNVPHITLMVGASYGAGNYAMAGRAYRPRFVFSWPNHKIAVMGPKQLAGVLSIIKKNAAEALGKTIDEDQDAQYRATIEAQIEAESTALFATGRIWDDGIIDPRDTRRVLSIALSACQRVEGTAVFGVVRH